MLKLFDKKDTPVFAPVSGKIVPLEKVPDTVFSERIMGEGIAVIAGSKYVCAPADGRLTSIAETNHAFAMTLKNEAEVLVHVGLETVALKGKGFKVLAKPEQKIKAGMPILELDLEYFAQKNILLFTPILVMNPAQHPIRFVEHASEVIAGQNILYKVS